MPCAISCRPSPGWFSWLSYATCGQVSMQRLCQPLRNALVSKGERRVRACAQLSGVRVVAALLQTEPPRGWSQNRLIRERRRIRPGAKAITAVSPMLRNRIGSGVTFKSIEGTALMAIRCDVSFMKRTYPRQADRNEATRQCRQNACTPPVAWLRQRAPAQAASPQRRTFPGNERRPTQNGKNYCDSVFGPMAFFPIVFRKVGRYVALHESKKARQAHCRSANERFRGGGAYIGATIPT